MILYDFLNKVQNKIKFETNKSKKMSKVGNVGFESGDPSLTRVTLKFLLVILSHLFKVKWNEKPHNDKRPE